MAIHTRICGTLTVKLPMRVRVRLCVCLYTSVLGL